MSIAELQALNLENKRRLAMDLVDELNNQQQHHEKLEKAANELSNSQKESIKSINKFRIRTPSQGSKRNSIDNGSTKANSTPTANARGSNSTMEKSRKSSNVSENDSNKPYEEVDEELKHQNNGVTKANGQYANNLLDGDSFHSIEENSSEKSNSDSPLLTLVKPSKFDTRNAKSKRNGPPEQVKDTNESFSLANITSITLHGAEIKFGDPIGEGRILE